MPRKFVIQKKKLQTWLPLAFMVTFCGVGASLLVGTHAATPSWSLSGTTVVSSRSGATVTFKSTIKNTGLGASTTFNYGVHYIYSSTATPTHPANSGYSGEIPATGHVVGQPLAAGASLQNSNLMQTVTIPASETAKYICGTVAISPYNSSGGTNYRSTAACVLVKTSTTTTGGSGSSSGGSGTSSGTGSSGSGSSGTTSSPSPSPSPSPTTGDSSQSGNDGSGNTIADNSDSDNTYVDGDSIPDTSPDSGPDTSSDDAGTSAANDPIDESGTSGSSNIGKTNTPSKTQSPAQHVSTNKSTSATTVGVTFVTLGVLIPVCVLALFLIKRKQTVPVPVSTASQSDAFLNSIASTMAPPEQQMPAAPVSAAASTPVLTTPVTTISPGQPAQPTAPAAPAVSARAGEDDAAAKARLQWWAADGTHGLANQQAQSRAAETDNPPDMFEEGQKRLEAAEKLRNPYQ